MSVYDSIGGAPAVRAAVDDFYARVVADSRLTPFFARTDMERLKAHQRAFIAAAIGGPEIYAGRDMTAAHAGLGIGDADFDAVVAQGTPRGAAGPCAADQRRFRHRSARTCRADVSAAGRRRAR